MATKSPTLDNGISALALKRLSKATPEDFLAEFKKQGITSLEDLAKQTAAIAQLSGKQGIAADWEDYGICYKFTMVRPKFDQGALKEILAQIETKFIH
jgi:hypothetical protein